MEPEEYLYYLSDGSTLFYRLRRRRGMRRLYLYILEHGRLEVRCAPQVTFETIEAFLREKESWFLPRLHAPRPLRLDPEKFFLYLGERYPVETTLDPTLGESLRMHLNREAKRVRIFSSLPPLPSDLWELYERFWRQNAPAVLGEELREWSEIMGLSPTRVGFRRNRSRWGSCSSRGSINLNTRLMLLPETLRDYVIVHELAHLRELNHSPAFWHLVEAHIPDYKARRKALSEYGVYLR